MSRLACVFLKVALLLMSSSHVLAQDCDLSMTATGNIFWDEDIGGYNPFSNQTNTLTADIDIYNDSSKKCDFHITASSVNYTGRPQQRFAVKGDETIEYYLATSQSTDSKRQWWDYPDAKKEKRHVLNGKVGGEQGASLPFFMIVPAGQRVSSGLYTDSSTIEAWRGKHKKNREPKLEDLRDSEFIHITIPVLFFSEINFETLTGGKNYAAELGVLQQGSSRDFRMWVTHSTPFNIQARSENNGKLKNAINGQLLPYVFRYGAEIVTLDSGVTLLAENQRATFLRAYPLSISIDIATNNYSQGNYNDKIYIDLISL